MPRSAHKLVLVLTILLLIVGQTYLITTPKAFAADGINKQINFQGKVVNSNGTNVADGSYNFVFKIYSTPSGGSPIWTETRSGGNQVQVQAGIFRVSLGSVQSLPGSVNFNSDSLYLGIEFNGDGEMTPRVRFASVPYAFNAGTVNGLTVTNTSGNPFSSTTTLQIADGKTVVVNNGLTFSGTDSTTFTFPSTTGVVVTEAFAQTLTSKTIGSTGLIFSGAATDITTAANEVLGISPNGIGNVLINPTAGGQAALIIDKLGNNDIFTASAAGTTRFTINNAGAIGLTGGFGIATQCLTSNGSGAAASWGSCGAGGGGTNYWQLNGPVLSPGNSTVDLAIGGTSTSSAKFAITGIAGSQTPVATLSATTPGTGIVIGGDGSIQSLQQGTLVLGGATTGNIKLVNTTGDTILNARNNQTVAIGADADPGNWARLYLNGGFRADDDFRFQKASGTQYISRLNQAGSGGASGYDLTFQVRGDNISMFGAGGLIINNSSDSNNFFQVKSSQQANSIYLTGNTGNFGLGTSTPNSQLYVTRPLASVANGKALAIFDQIENQDILTASYGGVTKFTIKNDGTASVSAGLTINSVGSVQATNGQTLTIGGGDTGNITISPNSGGILIVGSAANGLTFNPSSNGPTYTGTARPIKSVVLSPEYAGAALTTDGSSTTNGSMTADNTLNTGGVGWKNYYEWTSTQGALQDYTITVRVTLPQDFDSWQTGSCGGSTCALEIAYQTGVSGTTDNAVSVQVNNAENSPGSVICTIAAASSTTWSTFGCTSTDLATSPTWNTAGDVAILRIKLAADSTSSALARVGDITLRYFAKY
ncbi:MAG TPA: hypothetical protein VG917_01545 [Patescibacteria group bacterium]|nr:hypothetical protein [Patescibacteria group bacterium]